MNPYGRYEELEDAGTVRRRLEALLEEYNQKPGVVPLKMVLFRDAVEHVCRIARVVSQPLGHVLLVGIGKPSTMFRNIFNTKSTSHS